MATMFKIKKDGEIIAQACNPNMAAYIALSYNAEVNWDNKTTVWNPKKERRGWLHMTAKAVDELAVIIVERVNEYERAKHERTLQKYKQEAAENPALAGFYTKMTNMAGQAFQL
jgi:hypothetical protein